MLVLLEAPTRVAATLVDLCEVFGPGRRAVVGRELTKLHEEILRSTLGELVLQLGQRPGRGEYTLVVEGAVRPARTLPEATIPEQVRLAEERLGLDRKAAMSYVAKERGIPRREIYAALLAQREDR